MQRVAVAAGNHQRPAVYFGDCDSPHGRLDTGEVLADLFAGEEVPRLNEVIVTAGDGDRPAVDGTGSHPFVVTALDFRDLLTSPGQIRFQASSLPASQLLTAISPCSDTTVVSEQRPDRDP